MAGNLAYLVKETYSKGKRLVAPLMGLPGVSLVGEGMTIKYAQQNHKAHYDVIKSLTDTFSPDMACFLMDLSVEANAMGMHTLFPVEETATVHSKVNVEDKTQLKILRGLDITADSRVLSYVRTMEHMSTGLPKDINKVAYVSGPYSLAALIMGAQEAAMATVLQPDVLHHLCDITTEKIQKYARMLTTAGAESIVIAEPTAVMLGPDHFEEFSGNYVRHIVNALQHDRVNLIYHTCGNTMKLVDKMVKSGVDGISLDSEDVGIELDKVAEMIPKDVVVIGNISPTRIINFGTPEDVKTEVNNLMGQMKPYSKFILSTGCAIPQEAPIDNIKSFMQAGREYRG